MRGIEPPHPNPLPKGEGDPPPDCFTVLGTTIFWYLNKCQELRCTAQPPPASFAAGHFFREMTGFCATGAQSASMKNIYTL